MKNEKKLTRTQRELLQKKLTRTQRELLQANGLNPAEYRRVKDLPRLLQVVHCKTGKYTLILK